MTALDTAVDMSATLASADRLCSGEELTALADPFVVTTAPIAVRSRNGSSSRPNAEQPEAVSTGLGMAALASVADMSTAVSSAVMPRPPSRPRPPRRR